MEVDIIGAGIGGLTTAIALEQKGIKVNLYEQAAIIKPVGAGIILANNAMQVFQKLGLKELIEEHGNHIGSVNITKANLKVISKVDLSYFEKLYGVKNIAIHRAMLQNILVDHLKSTKLNLDHRLEDVESISDEYNLIFENKSNKKSVTLIGADGINSKVRSSLFPASEIRDANQICWRGVTDYDLPVKYKNELNEAWGDQDRFGFVQISEQKVYWYALKSVNKELNEPTISDLGQHFSNYNSIIKEIISSTSVDQIHKAKITDLKPNNNWYNENCCLIGDAAHATTPNMGQGACQAIEDAYVISELLSQENPNLAFKNFQKTRSRKVNQVVNGSWALGKIAHASNPIVRKIRNQFMSMTPQFLSRMQSKQIFQLDTIKL